jgi:hypothetical protein
MSLGKASPHEWICFAKSSQVIIRKAPLPDGYVDASSLRKWGAALRARGVAGIENKKKKEVLSEGC